MTDCRRFFAGYKIRDRSLPFRLWSEVVCWGIVQAGVWSIFSAQHCAPHACVGSTVPGTQSHLLASGHLRRAAGTLR
jgi:hypothetical protein